MTEPNLLQPEARGEGGGDPSGSQPPTLPVQGVGQPALRQTDTPADGLHKPEAGMGLRREHPCLTLSRGRGREEPQRTHTRARPGLAWPCLESPRVLFCESLRFARSGAGHPCLMELDCGQLSPPAPAAPKTAGREPRAESGGEVGKWGDRVSGISTAMTQMGLGAVSGQSPNALCSVSSFP